LETNDYKRMQGWFCLKIILHIFMQYFACLYMQHPKGNATFHSSSKQ